MTVTYAVIHNSIYVQYYCIVQTYIFTYCYAGPCPQLPQPVTSTLLPTAAAHRTGGTDTGMLLGEDSWLTRGSEVKDP